MNASHGMPQFFCTTFDGAVEKTSAFLSKDIGRSRTLRTFAGACIIRLGKCNRNCPSEVRRSRYSEHRPKMALGDMAHAVSTVSLRQQMGYMGELPKERSNALVPEC